MRGSKPTGRRYFTEAANAAALKTRLKKAADRAADPSAAIRPRVYVVRSPSNERAFGWEIRKFGGVTIERSSISYASAAEAQNAGVAVLALHGAEASGGDAPGKGQFNGGFPSAVLPQDRRL